jgi:glycosyltransferase 2 family protein
MFRSFKNPDAPVSLSQRVFSLPTLVSLALAAAFLVFLVVRFDVDLGATWQQVRGSNPWLLALALLVHYTTFIFRGARWRLLLHNAQGPEKPPPGVLYCSELTLLGWFTNSVAWFRLGDAYRAYLYHDEQEASFTRTIGTILSERMLDAVLVLALLLLSVPFVVGPATGASWTVVALAAAVLAVPALALLVVARVRVRLVRWLPERLAGYYQRFYEGALGSFRQLPLVTLLGLLGWLAEVGRLYLVTLALGIDLGLPLIVFITLANSLLTLVPTPGGIGAVESGVAGLLVRLSPLAASGAAALVLVDRSISYVSIIITGAALFLGRQAYRRRRSAASPSSTIIEPQ